MKEQAAISSARQIENVYFDTIRDRAYAHDIAHDIRKFEIELYWKRNSYFWGFQVSFFAAFGFAVTLTATSTVDFEILGRHLMTVSQSPTKAAFFFQSLLLCAIPLCAAIFSELWLHMISGAKAWQDNWERHIDILEDHVVGPLYKTYFFEVENSGISRGPFSVTKVNRRIVLVLMMLWIALAAASFIYTLELAIKSGYVEATIFEDNLLVLAVILPAIMLTWPITAASLRMSYAGEKITPGSPISKNSKISHHLYRRDILKNPSD